MDLLLPKLDGISVLKEASSLPKPPLGLVLTGFLTDYAAQAAEKLGVRYFISKPCNLQMVAERVMEIVAAERADKKPFRQEAQVEALVTSIIHEIGWLFRLNQDAGYLACPLLSCSCSLSAMRAMNSELVGLPLVLETV